MQRNEECVPGPQEKKWFCEKGKVYINIKRKCAAVKIKGKLSDLGNHFFTNPKAGIIKVGSVWGGKIGGGSKRWEEFK